MPPVFGPAVAVEDALVVLRRGERDRVVAVAQARRTRLPRRARNSSMTTRRRSPSPPPKIVSMAASASASVVRDDHALAGGEAVGLDHDRRAVRAHIVLGRPRPPEALIGRGRDALARHRSLVKPFEPSSRAAALLGPNALMPAASRSSTMPAASGTSGPTTTKIDALAWQKAITARVVGEVERDAFGLPRDAGIAGRAIEPVDQRACRDFPGERVLASAGADEEDVQANGQQEKGAWASPYHGGPPAQGRDGETGPVGLDRPLRAAH